MKQPFIVYITHTVCFILMNIGCLKDRAEEQEILSRGALWVWSWEKINLSPYLNLLKYDLTSTMCDEVSEILTSSDVDKPTLHSNFLTLNRCPEPSGCTLSSRVAIRTQHNDGLFDLFFQNHQSNKRNALCRSYLCHHLFTSSCLFFPSVGSEDWYFAVMYM